MKTDSDFLKFIYEGGKVPIEDIESGKYQAVRSLIGKLCNALNGGAYLSGNPKPHISHTRFSAEESEWINRRIVELREGPAKMTFNEIAKELKVGLNRDAIQKRYVNNADRLRSAEQTKTDVLLITPFSDSQLGPEPVRTSPELPCSAETANNIAALIKSEQPHAESNTPLVSSEKLSGDSHEPVKAEAPVFPESSAEVASAEITRTAPAEDPKPENLKTVAEPPALQETKEMQIESASILDGSSAKEVLNASDLKVETSCLKVRSVDDLDDAKFAQLKKCVYTWNDEGLDVKQISEMLRADGIDFPWPKVRAMLARHAKEEKAAREANLSPEAEKARLEGKIWNLYMQAKMSPMEIAGHLTVRIEEVEAIIRKIQREGAK